MVKRIIKVLFYSVSGIIVIALLVAFAGPLWRHWITYPQMEKQVNEFQKLRKEPAFLSNNHTYLGVMQAHSYLSHDSKGTLNDIIPAAKSDGIDFIFLTDHPHGDSDTIPKGYHGNYGGVLIESGTENRGFDCWPLVPTIINWKLDKDTVAKQIVSNGGIIFYAHTEEPHNWGNPDFQGMEIYNFHTDTKDGESASWHILNFMVNGNKFRPWALREFFDEQTTILARWDSLNMKRKIVGFSAVDSHENQSFRARYLKDGRIQWIGPNAKAVDTMEVRFWNKWLFSEPDKSGWVFKWMIDTYQSGFNYITNYVMSDSLSVHSLAENMKKGHLYTAFKSLGDAKGFQYYASNQKDSIIGILGDSIKIDQVKALKAVSPLPGQFRLIHDGKTVNISSGEDYQYSWSELIEKGAYRLEMHIKQNGKLIPWLYANPIYIY